MPRRSSAETAASFYRATRQRVEPPRRLPARAKAIWREILASKPIDYFDVGHHGLLADYCETQEALERCRVDLRRLRLDCATSDRLFDRTIKLGSRLSTLARQLRLTVQWTTDRRATKAGETSS